MTEQFETVIVGGGQAGLATGYHLKRRGRSCVILDAGERVGDSWRKRWPSLRLYSPARFDSLPGLAFPAPKHSFPSGHEMADYLATYAESLELPVRTGVRVDAVTREGGGYLVTAGDLRFEAENVVVATGAFDVPSIPDFAGELDAAIVQIHSNDYRSPAQLREGPVLVVGAAHSGSDIAYEAAMAGHETILSGRDTGQIPAPIESRRARPILSVLRFVWTRVLTMDTPVGRRASRKSRTHGGPLLRIRRAELAAAGVERVHERTVGAQGGLPVLDGGRVLDVANVVWCTGFRPDYSWIDVPFEYDEDGYPRQYRGVVDSAPGLYFVGLPFLHSFSSMLVLGAGRDGERLAEHIVARAGERRLAAEPKPDALLSR